MRTASSTGITKIFPSPILPVFADSLLSLPLWLRHASLTTTSSFTRGGNLPCTHFHDRFLCDPLPAKAFDFADGHALDSYIGQSGFNVLQLEGFDYGFDELHFFWGCWL